MKASETLRLVALVEDRWASWRPNDDQRRRFAEDIADLDAAELAATIEAVYREGRQWAPNAGELRQRLAVLQLGAPEWAEVKRQLVERHIALQTWEPPEWTCPLSVCDGSGYVEIPDDYGPTAKRCDCWPQRADARRLAESLDPLVREFIAKRYVTWGEVEEVGQGAATTLEAQMRAKWDAYVSRAVQSRAVASIETAAQLRRLEQARDEDAPRRELRAGQLGRPDFAAALPKAS